MVSLTPTLGMELSLAAASNCSVSGDDVCSLTTSTTTSLALNKSSVSDSTVGATSVPSSIAALKAGGVLLIKPAAWVRYSGTGSVTAIGAPSWAALMASSSPLS